MNANNGVVDLTEEEHSSTEVVEDAQKKSRPKRGDGG